MEQLLATDQSLDDVCVFRKCLSLCNTHRSFHSLGRINLRIEHTRFALLYGKFGDIFFVLSLLFVYLDSVGVTIILYDKGSLPVG